VSLPELRELGIPTTALFMDLFENCWLRKLSLQNVLENDPESWVLEKTRQFLIHQRYITVLRVDRSFDLLVNDDFIDNIVCRFKLLILDEIENVERCADFIRRHYLLEELEIMWVKCEDFRQLHHLVDAILKLRFIRDLTIKFESMLEFDTTYYKCPAMESFTVKLRSNPGEDSFEEHLVLDQLYNYVMAMPNLKKLVVDSSQIILGNGDLLFLNDLNFLEHLEIADECDKSVLLNLKLRNLKFLKINLFDTLEDVRAKVWRKFLRAQPDLEMVILHDSIIRETQWKAMKKYLKNLLVAEFSYNPENYQYLESEEDYIINFNPSENLVKLSRKM
jgi:hypothetical protein